MKLTEMQLLQAIGQADEKTVNRTAPRQPEETGRLPIRIRRRALEMIAVCAALCIFVGGGFLIRNLYRAQNPVMPYSDEETAALEVLERFFAACKKGDQQKMRELSLMETVCDVIYENDPEQIESTVQEYLDAFACVSDYQIVSIRDATDSLDCARIIENELCEYYAYLFEEKGKHAEAEKMRGMTPAKDYYSRADRLLAVTVRISGTDPEGNSFPEEDGELQVIRYDGKWYVQPIEMIMPYMGEEKRQKLNEYRANDPNYHGDAELTVPAEDAGDENLTPEDREAKAAITAFLDLCMTGDADAIRKGCLLDRQLSLMRPDGTDQTGLQVLWDEISEAEWEQRVMNGILYYMYQAEYQAELADAEGILDRALAEAAAATYYDAWRLERARKHAEAMERLSDDPLTFFLREFDSARYAVVNVQTMISGKPKMFAVQIVAGHDQDGWQVMPCLLRRTDTENLSDEERAELDTFIRSVKNLAENDLPEYENNAKWKTWSTADTKKAEQQFSGGEIRAGMPVIELTEAKLPPAGGTALSLLVGPEYTVPYTVSFDFRMPDASPGVLNFVTCYGANTVPDDEPYGEQRYWYKLQPNGMISYETSFGHGSEEFRGFLEKNASEQCFDPKKWNTMSLKTTETGTEVFINGVFAASLPDPNGMRSDLTGRLALDGAKGMMLRHFVFEDGIS